MLLRALDRGRVHLYCERLHLENLQSGSNIPTAVEHIACLETAIRESLQRHHTQALAVIPEGPYVVPFVA